jgi:hypothetical protein
MKQEVSLPWKEANHTWLSGINVTEQNANHIFTAVIKAVNMQGWVEAFWPWIPGTVSSLVLQKGKKHGTATPYSLLGSKFTLFTFSVVFF